MLSFLGGHDDYPSTRRTVIGADAASRRGMLLTVSIGSGADAPLLLSRWGWNVRRGVLVDG